MKKNKATSKLHCIALPVALLTLSTSLVQASSILDSMDRLRRASYGTPDYAERDLDEQKRFAPYSPADSDLGDQLILRPYSKRVPVYARISTGLFFTDNVATTATGELDGVIWKSSAEVNWTPRIGNNLFAKFSLSQDIYRHDRLNQIDFEHTYMHAGLVKIVPDFYDTLFFTRLEYSRITRGSISNSAYASSRFRVGAHKVFLSTPRHTAYVALDAAWDINTTPSAGESIGEVNLYDPSVASASVIAQGYTKVWKSSHAGIEKFIESNPVAGNKLLIALIGELRRRIRKTNELASFQNFWS